MFGSRLEKMGKKYEVTLQYVHGNGVFVNLRDNTSKQASKQPEDYEVARTFYEEVSMKTYFEEYVAISKEEEAKEKDAKANDRTQVRPRLRLAETR